MIFSSVDFLVFFVVFFLLFFLSNEKYRIPLLIIASFAFYAFWKVSFIFLPLFLTYIAYLGTHWINKAHGKIKKQRLIIIIVLLLLPLIFYKYTNFLVQDVLGIFIDLTAWRVSDIGLPLGISFITFTLIAYVVDIYSGKFKLVNEFKITTVYTVFFPHLIAGPIMRPKELIPQFQHYSFSRSLFTYGLLVFSIGLLKKVIFADQLGLAVEEVYNTESLVTKLDYIIAFYAFPVQIYSDFSGYTDMAIGLALMLGIKFPNNFNRPYLSLSFVDFWKRWHITLSKWIRDYIYIPLGGNRNGKFNQNKNVLIAMAISGLWHGASWTFVLWGIYHGIFCVLTNMLRDYKVGYWIKSTPRWLKIIVIFHLIAISWVLFRANELDIALKVFEGVFVKSWDDVSVEGILVNLNYIILIIIFFLLHRYDCLARLKWFYRRYDKKIVYAFIVTIFLFSFIMGSGNSAEFIYYDF